MNRKQPKNLTLNKSGDHVGYQDYEVDSAGESCDHRWQYKLSENANLYQECAWCLKEREVDPRDHQEAIKYYIESIEQKLDQYSHLIKNSDVPSQKRNYEKYYREDKKKLAKFCRFLELDRPAATEGPKKSCSPTDNGERLEGKDENMSHSTNLNMPQGKRSPNNDLFVLGGREKERKDSDRVIPPSTDSGNENEVPPSKNNNNKEMANPHDMGNPEKLLGGREKERKEKDSTIPPSTKKRRKKGEGTGYLAKYNVRRRGKVYEQYNYHWEIWSDGELIARKRKYVPKRLVEKIQKMEAEKVPIEQILFLLL